MAKIGHISSLDVKILSRDVSSSSRNYQAVEARLELLKFRLQLCRLRKLNGAEDVRSKLSCFGSLELTTDDQQGEARSLLREKPLVQLAPLQIDLMFLQSDVVSVSLRSRFVRSVIPVTSLFSFFAMPCRCFRLNVRRLNHLARCSLCEARSFYERVLSFTIVNDKGLLSAKAAAGTHLPA
jgi:hypothetical protein